MICARHTNIQPSKRYGIVFVVPNQYGSHCAYLATFCLLFLFLWNFGLLGNWYDRKWDFHWSCKIKAILSAFIGCNGVAFIPFTHSPKYMQTMRLLSLFFFLVSGKKKEKKPNVFTLFWSKILAWIVSLANCVRKRVENAMNVIRYSSNVKVAKRFNFNYFVRACRFCAFVYVHSFVALHLF